MGPEDMKLVAEGRALRATMVLRKFDTHMYE
jgi:hypothetical protein